MSENNNTMNNTPSENENNQQFSLNDDRRVRTLSPGALVARRFLRNRVAVTGLVILAFMFVFSFIGGAITPYREDQLFYRNNEQKKQYAAVKENTEYRYTTAEGAKFPSVAQAKFVMAAKKNADTFEANKTVYTIAKEGEDFYAIYNEDGSELIATAAFDVVTPPNANDKIAFDLQYAILKAVTNGEKSFEYEGDTYTVSEDGEIFDGTTDVAYAGRYVVQAIMSDVFLTRSFKAQLLEAIESGSDDFIFTDEDGTTADYKISYDAKNIETIIGVVLGGLSGYCGGWVDNLIMRIVDIFYCIPSMPIIIILGAAMDAMRIDPQIRMLYLMLILGFLGWPGIARLVRGQILSLREQEFMTAAEATGIRASRRIFRHLIPNVIPQLIVTMTMSLGSTIITEATLSFLGLGVKFPFASWGNIINDVNDTYVLTNYWFIWIPAGVCLLATVLAFNLVGDGLRDAFDPKMKR